MIMFYDDDLLSSISRLSGASSPARRHHGSQPQLS